MADNDPRDTNHLPIGDGLIDWEVFFRILKRQGYDGYLGLDLGPSATLREDLIRSRERLIEIAAGIGIELGA